MPSFFFTVNFKQLINNKMKLAKSQPNEIQHIKNFLKECGWLKDVDFSDFELLKDFNSNIKAGQEAIELLKELRGFAPYCTDHRQRVDDILSKVSVDTEVSQNEA